MTPRKKLPSQEYLRECFEYNPETGILTWKTRPLHHFVHSHAMKIWNTRFSGNVAGKVCSARVEIGLNGLLWFAHRIIWKMVHNEEPDEIDHENLVPLDNALINLRPADTHQNKYNRRKYSNNTSGYKGVFPHENRWRSQIRVENKVHSLGLFDDPAIAHAAYCAAADKYHGEFARHQ